jgi:environmental stress-induced protein Ves
MINDLKETPCSLIRKQDYRIVKWKNGRGQSFEIALFPPEAVFPNDPFIWRLSLAEVTENGPFSEFPGYDRYLTLVEGTSVKLDFQEQRPKVTLKRGDLHHFSGELKASAEQVLTTITDLNLLYKRQEVRAHFEVIQISNKPRSFHLEGRIAFLFVVSGPITATIYPGEHKSVVREQNTLQINLPNNQSEGDSLVLLESEKPDALLALIEIDW